MKSESFGCCHQWEECQILERCLSEPIIWHNPKTGNDETIYDPEHCELGRRLGYVGRMTKTSERNVQITELTKPGRGSIRFGTRLGRNGLLIMLVGPFPMEHHIGTIYNEKGDHATLKQLGVIAQAAQEIVEQVYELPTGVRGTTFEETAEFVRASLGV